jgi:hypothetical protein
MEAHSRWAAGLAFAVALCLTFALAAPASAQSPYLDRGNDRTLLLEVLKPSFEGDDQPDFLTTTWLLGARLGVAPQTHIVLELPWAHYEEGDFSASTIGNPYVGIEYGATGTGPFGEFGVRPPLAASEDDDVVASLSGIFSDVDRWEDFWPQMIPVTAAFNYRYEAPTGFRARGRLGGSLWIPEEGGDAEFFTLFGGWAGYESPMLRVAGGWSGRVLLTEEGVFGDQTLHHQLSAAIDIGTGRVRPGAHLRLPLNSDLTDAVNLVFGISLGVRL